MSNSEPDPAHISFDNTEIAFSYKSNKELKKAYWLFKLISINFLVKVGPRLTNIALFLRLPIIPIIRATIFKHFCGGETIDQCDAVVNQMAKYNVKSVLDYSIEGEKIESVFDETTKELIKTVEYAKTSNHIPFTVFKITGLASFDLMAKIQSGEKLDIDEEEEWYRVKDRVDTICLEAFKAEVPVMIDAEESWIQEPIDRLVEQMMQKYNTEKAIVYNTFQFYRHDRLQYLKDCLLDAKRSGYKIGAKLVRGAYMEKERKRALEMHYPSPIQPNKEASDLDYNLALQLCIDNLDRISFVAGTHNEESSMKLVKLMATNHIPTNHPNIYFAQLLGMSDNLSFNLANAGYNVAKYVPYGPVKTVLPYLFRRAQENTAIAGQMGRELKLIVTELKRRRA